MDEAVRLLNGLLMLAAPLGLGWLLARRFRASWGLYIAGGLGFVGAQVLHLPFNAWVLVPALRDQGLMPGPSAPIGIGAALLFGASAGVFEECVRYLVFRLWRRDARSWEAGAMLGAGHGGAEALILGALVIYGFFQALAYRDVDLAGLLPADQLDVAQAQLQAYWSAPWYLAILGAVERSFALVIHLGLSLLVFQSISRGNLLWLALAIGWHTAVDAAALLALPSLGPLGAEAVIGLCAAASLLVVLATRPRRELEADDRRDEDSPTPRAILDKLPYDRESLDRSRFLDQG